MSTIFGFNFSPYLPPNARANLLAYQYHGTDKSLIYKYMWKPLCTRVVEMLPVWLAPNVITVTALALVCITHIILAWYFPRMSLEENDESPPSWIFVATGAALFAYQLLDNLDGHQARRTKTSSPLGLLMDHGCDAFNCIVGSLSVASSVCAGPSWKSWTVMVTAVIVFFMNTWEEYYRGALILPIINGPNEGILFAIGIYLVTAVQGPLWWSQNSVTIPETMLPQWLQREPFSAWLLETCETLHAPPLQCERVLEHMYEKKDSGDIIVLYNTIALSFMVLCAVVTCSGNIFQVYRAVNGANPEGHGKYGTGWLLTHFPFLHALTRLLPLAVISVVANAWFFLSPAQVFEQHPRLFCWTVGLLYTKLAIHLMIAHLCSVEFHPFRRTLVPFVFFAGHTLLSFWNRGTMPAMDEELLLWEFFGLAAVTFTHLVINASRETATELGVPIFTVPKEKQQALRDLAERKKK